MDLFPYRKEFVFIVLFLAFAESFFSDDFQDRLCTSECPAGLTLKRNENHKPFSDGCGSRGYSVDKKYLPTEIMEKCCDDHDLCYDECSYNITKPKCDLRFKDCLYTACGQIPSSLWWGKTKSKLCEGFAKILYTIVSSTSRGCISYMEAHRQACFCG